MAEQTDSPDRPREAPETGAAPPSVSPEQGSQAVAEGAQEEVAARTEHAQAVATAAAGPAEEGASLSDTGGTSPAEADAAAIEGEGFAERPEVLVAGAFAGGLLLAIVLRSIKRG